MAMFSFIGIVILGRVVVVTGEIYTSSYQVERLSTREGELMDVIERYIEQEQSRIAQLRRSIKELKGSRWKNSSVVDDPVSAYLFIKRFQSGWHDTVTVLKDQTNLRESVANIHNIVGQFPGSEDVTGARNAVIRLQLAYNLTAQDMIKMSSGPIASSECFRLAESGFQLGYKNLATDWLREAVALKHPGPEFEHARDEMVKDIIQHAIQSSPEVTCATEINNSSKTKSVNERTANEVTNLHKRCKQSSESAIQEEDQFFKLCRSSKVPQRRPSEAVCTYRLSTVPYRRWKEERLSTDPKIFIFHDVITDSEIEHIKRLSIQLLERSAVGSLEKALTPEERTSKVAWLWDNHTEIVHGFSRRVTEITGLATEFFDKGAYAEPLQVLNYGIGGQYHSHYDFYENDEMLEKTATYVRDSGDRLATFMFYLSHVDAGGATAFPELNLKIPPIKGSAAFWFNFKHKKRDWRTKHGGCPVLKGHKWVANKWIHQIADWG